MNDSLLDYTLAILVAQAINLAIIWLIVNSATKSDRRHSMAQTELLSRIAMKQGVPVEEVEEIFKKARLTFK